MSGPLLDLQSAARVLTDPQRAGRWLTVGACRFLGVVTARVLKGLREEPYAAASLVYLSRARGGTARPPIPARTLAVALSLAMKYLNGKHVHPRYIYALAGITAREYPRLERQLLQELRYDLSLR